MKWTNLITLLALACLATLAVGVEFNVGENSDGNSDQGKAEPSILHAARIGDLPTVEMEIAAGRVNFQNRDGWTPLIFAVDGNQIEACWMLLRAGADVNLRENDGWTALMMAAFSGGREMIELLLQAGADALVVIDQGVTAQRIAEAAGHTDQARLIADHALVQAINKNDMPAMLDLVLPAKASPNTANAAGWTALITACSAGDVRAVTMLLDAPGVDSNQPERDGWTPLMFAANQRICLLPNTAKLLQKCILTCNNSYYNPNNPPTLPALLGQQNNPDIVTLLLAHSADPLKPSSRGFTALGLAQERGFWTVIELLTRAADLKSDSVAQQAEKNEKAAEEQERVAVAAAARQAELLKKQEREAPLPKKSKGLFGMW